MKLIPLLLFVICLTNQGLSQKFPIKFGDVSLSELQMKKYAKDTSAAAVILCDFGQSTISYSEDDGFRLLYEHVKRIKVLKKAGLEWGEIKIPLYRSDRNSKEDISGLKAVTYNLVNGKIVETKLPSSSVFREEVNRYRDILKIAMPAVEVGSVIEITFRINSPFLFNLQQWAFQTTIPVQLSEYRVRYPEYFDYKQNTQGFIKVPYERKMEAKTIRIVEKQRGGSSMSASNLRPSNANQINHSEISYSEIYDRWAISDVPAFVIESSTANYTDYLAAVFFELASYKLPSSPPKNFNTTWEDLNDEFLQFGSFGGLIAKSDYVNDLTSSVIQGKSSASDKINAIYAYVKESVAWNGINMCYSDYGIRKTLEAKKGNSAAINLLLVAMLRSAGLQSSPVLISTRGNGAIKMNLPNADQFDYVIAAVQKDSAYHFLDATDRLLPINVLPERCLNGKGFLVDEKDPVWVTITPTKSLKMIDADVAIGADGELKGTVQITYSGYFARAQRGEYIEHGNDGYVKDIASAYSWDVTSSDIKNVDDISKSIISKYGIVSDSYGQTSADKIYFNPLFIEGIPKNPYVSQSRVFPLEIAYPEDIIFTARIKIPDGWTVEELPKPKILFLPENGMKCTYNISLTNDLLVVTNRFSVNNTFYPASMYPVIRDYYNMVIAKHAEQVVLRKK